MSTMPEGSIERSEIKRREEQHEITVQVLRHRISFQGKQEGERTEKLRLMVGAF